MSSSGLRCMYLLVLQDAAEQHQTRAAAALQFGDFMGAVKHTRTAGEMLALGSLSRDRAVPLRKVQAQARDLGLQLASER